MSLNIGNTSDKQTAEASHYKKVVVGFIDIVAVSILFALFSGDKWASPVYSLPFPLNSILLILPGLILYRLITLLLINGTIGMKLMDVQFLSGDGLELSFKEKVLASLFVLYKGVNYYNR